MYILGVHGNFGKAEHDASAVLIRDGEIIAAAEEERFVRYKHAVGLMPDKAIQFCLDTARITMKDVDIIAFPRSSWQDFDERFKAYLWYNFGATPKIEYIDHHTAHAASAYFISGFSSSLIITLDQSGDGIACAAFRGTANKELHLLGSIPFPHSLGLFAAFITQYLGFRSNHDEYKVMGLSSYGKPTIDLTGLISSDNGDIRLNERIFHPEVMKRHPVFHTDQLPMFLDMKYSGLPPRRVKNGKLFEEHKNLAASAQKAIEDAILAFIKKFKTDDDTHLCIAGGVGENSVANGKLAQSKIFQDIYVAPACGDSGTALGAALYVGAQNGFQFKRVENNKWGPSYDEQYIKNCLEQYHIPYEVSENLSEDIAQMLVDQNIVALFHGKMEFGPRALGSRSLIADPSHESMRRKVNSIKKREQFRPFAPSVLEEKVEELFTTNQTSPFMSFTLNTTSAGKKKIVAATHIDFSGRLQTVSKSNDIYRRIIEAFYAKTSVPAILNTSLNSGWEPIIESPEQALAFFFSSEADILVLENFVVRKHGK